MLKNYCHSHDHIQNGMVVKNIVCKYKFTWIYNKVLFSNHKCPIKSICLNEEVTLKDIRYSTNNYRVCAYSFISFSVCKITVTSIWILTVERREEAIISLKDYSNHLSAEEHATNLRELRNWSTSWVENKSGRVWSRNWIRENLFG